MSELEDKYAERMNLTVFEPLKLERSWTLEVYRSIGGYQVWEKILAGGMTQEQIQLALEPFVQVDNSLHRKYEGAGLGLPLAKAFIEVQGGRFEVESKPGRGTAVRFVLAAQPGAAVMAATAAMPGQATGKEP